MALEFGREVAKSKSAVELNPSNWIDDLCDIYKGYVPGSAGRRRRNQVATHTRWIFLVAIFIPAAFTFGDNPYEDEIRKWLIKTITMRKLTFLLMLSLSAVLTVQAQHVAPGNIVKADDQALAKIKAGKAYLVDVRTPAEFDGGHLEYATNINFNSPDFKSQIAKLDKRKPVYLYCRSGNRSGKAADTLKTLGFHAYYNIGGFEQLKAEGFPTGQLQTHAAQK